MAEMGSTDPSTNVSSPVEPDERVRVPDGTALCLSGGGYRAMLFHVGALWRLNELGYLTRLDRVSSVSGGSITAGCLAVGWRDLRFDGAGTATNLREVLVDPIRGLAGRTIDVASVVIGALTPSSAAGRVAGALRKHLMSAATLQDLPDRPRFVINATNLQSGALWRFSKPYMADYTVGLIRQPDVPVAVAVAASAAFPPVLSPLHLTVDPQAFEPAANGPLAQPPFNTRVELSDGGVYDNLALETAWKRCSTLLVSDGGGRLGPEGSIAWDWARHAIRVNSVIDHQVRNLRKRQLIAGFRRGDRAGVYWGIRTDVADYGPPGALPCPPKRTTVLAETPTRLKRMPAALQERLVNWGYAVCDAAMRSRVEPDAEPPVAFPYPRTGIG